MRFKLLFFIFSLIVCISLNKNVLAESDDDDTDDFSTHPDPNAGQPPQQQKQKYVRPVPNGEFYFVETFEENVIGKKWLKSKAKKDDVEEDIAKYDGQWSVESSADAVLEGDQGLVLKSKAKHHAISSRLVKQFQFSQDKPLVVQYEVKFQNPMECGGAYIKLLASDAKLDLEQFFDILYSKFFKRIL